jgi:hypothetical protein
LYNCTPLTDLVVGEGCVILTKNVFLLVCPRIRSQEFYILVLQGTYVETVV